MTRKKIPAGVIPPPLLPSPPLLVSSLPLFGKGLALLVEVVVEVVVVEGGAVGEPFIHKFFLPYVSVSLLSTNEASEGLLSSCK